jgi:hypothetical protein
MNTRGFYLAVIALFLIFVFAVITLVLFRPQAPEASPTQAAIFENVRWACNRFMVDNPGQTCSPERILRDYPEQVASCEQQLLAPSGESDASIFWAVDCLESAGVDLSD